MATKVGINGFGRIGRQLLKIILERYPDTLEVVGINDLWDTEINAQLFKYDSSYGKFEGEVDIVDGNLVINGKTIQVFAERSPADLPWGELGVDIVFEGTGVFRDPTTSPGPQSHIEAGAKKVILTAPAKGGDVFTAVMGVNDQDYDPANHHIVSNASCTTNCLAPFSKVINDNFTIKKGLMTTIHSYTTSQNVLDLADSDPRRARAAAINIIPTSTGAAKAIALVIPELKGKLDGYSLRVPTPTVSIVDAVFEVEKDTTAEEVNAALKAASEGVMKGYLGFSEEPLVSMDFKGDERSSIVDADLTAVMDGNMVKVVSWYDNEWGYATRLTDFAAKIAKSL
ncbi:MAG: type I glyceraldehyde-3-phosphate dehydrogenase [Anaerolineae bacterium]|jgi:glyceraldehyde 3-phosphate dehydrogenase|nr:type I glyceraldehyde-3-phosphate dehydrogenase [Anaerolineae bacterium]MBT3713779.1 type I glyceraldehyde-3-phosphate dehydrogenase [Anaerolineae bacterium]MBT4309927.1 type I glyceraldehyde-3-phosphate dehydrogenase [Anaerolineae bacterium]MBT4456801.1 type I glyceraldehyde-3-phosphate dehydrogenase [Anaerolineae bacterium]MBT4842149.1 type I glyceraldehyde-3-phosphate dehydrogenase [Anaerolineae bacterium]